MFCGFLGTGACKNYYQFTNNITALISIRNSVIYFMQIEIRAIRRSLEESYKTLASMISYSQYGRKT